VTERSFFCTSAHRLHRGLGLPSFPFTVSFSLVYQFLDFRPPRSQSIASVFVTRFGACTEETALEGTQSPAAIPPFNEQAGPC